jgi:hypothetical protein
LNVIVTVSCWTGALSSSLLSAIFLCLSPAMCLS